MGIIKSNYKPKEVNVEKLLTYLKKKDNGKHNKLGKNIL
jgi:hypothetical protein|tara:strand:+ start:915 stop:1031 length:117 start_codon:yes stop_codon:yes gene_type:complete